MPPIFAADSCRWIYADLPRRQHLLGSANFTAGGLRNNIELGVRVTGAVAAEIERLVDRLESVGWLKAPS
jgi:phosphatidylserine/phosphatidylglycerophosphate/cardiolipin synthase-like enzyme